MRFVRICKIFSDVWLFFLRARFYRILEKDCECVKNILVIRLDETGDVVLVSAFLRELRHRFKDSNITLVVRPDSFNLVELCPYVDKVYAFKERLVYDARLLNFFKQSKRQIRALLFAKKYLFKNYYDIAFVPRWDTDYYNASLLAYYSGARYRIGYSSSVDVIKSKLNSGFDLLYTHLCFESAPKHEALRNLDLLSFFDGDKANHLDSKLEVWTCKDDYKFLDSIDLKKPVIAFGIGGREEKKRWPNEFFCKLGARLVKDYDATIVLLGGKAEMGLVNPLSGVANRFIDLSGVVTWRQTSALLSKCDLFIGNNTATLHIACAVKIPVIEISCHPSVADDAFYLSPTRFGALTKARSATLRPDAGDGDCVNGCVSKVAHCIRKISVDDVFMVAKELLR